MTRLLPLASVGHERLNIGRYWCRQFRKPTEVDVVAGCSMVVRREVIDSVGGLDEDFFMYGEDEEWCSRIKRAGWLIIYFPGAVIVHIHRFSSCQTRRIYRVTDCMSPVLVLHKRRGPLIAWFGNLFLLFGLIARLPAWLVLDAFRLHKGTAQKDLFRSRFFALGAHLKGIVRPVWLPHTAKPAAISANPTTGPVLR